MFRNSLATSIVLLALLAAGTAFAAVGTDATGNVVWNKRHIDLTLRVTDDVAGVQLRQIRVITRYRRDYTQGGLDSDDHEVVLTTYVRRDED